MPKRSELKNGEFKTLWILAKLHAEITSYGMKGETYNDIVARILQVYRKYKDVYEKENKKEK